MNHKISSPLPLSKPTDKADSARPTSTEADNVKKMTFNCKCVLKITGICTFYITVQ